MVILRHHLALQVGQHLAVMVILFSSPYCLVVEVAAVLQIPQAYSVEEVEEVLVVVVVVLAKMQFQAVAVAMAQYLFGRGN